MRAAEQSRRPADAVLAFDVPGNRHPWSVVDRRRAGGQQREPDQPREEQRPGSQSDPASQIAGTIALASKVVGDGWRTSNVSCSVTADARTGAGGASLEPGDIGAAVARGRDHAGSTRPRTGMARAQPIVAASSQCLAAAERWRASRVTIRPVSTTAETFNASSNQGLIVPPPSSAIELSPPAARCGRARPRSPARLRHRAGRPPLSRRSRRRMFPPNA